MLRYVTYDKCKMVNVVFSIAFTSIDHIGISYAALDLGGRTVDDDLLM